MYKNKKFKGDKSIILLTISLSIFGLVMIFDASAASALKDFNDKFHYLKLQFVWFFVGLLALYFFSRFSYQNLKKIAFPLFLFNLFLLIIVLIPGIGKEYLGGRRWLPLFNIGFQPAELIKLSLVIYFSTLFDKKKDFFLFALPTLIVFVLLLLEPDLGTAAVILGSSLALYFISEAPIKYLIYSGIFLLVAGPISILFSNYRKARLISFFKSIFDIQNSSYHIRQAIIALGAGGLFGRGFGQSKQKYFFVPEVTTDSIFAIIGEELGMIGAILIISCFIFLVYRGLRIASKAPDRFGKLLCSGLIFVIGFQVIINLSAIVSLVPMTGIPLPFISYGGSSLVIFLSCMGIVYNISKQ